MVDDMVSRLIEEDAKDDLVSGLNSLVRQNLSLNGDKNGPSLILSNLPANRWSVSQPVHQGWPTFRNKNNVIDPLKILTNELAENLENDGSGIHGSRHPDSGYISTDLLPASDSGQVFFNDNSQHQALVEQPPSQLVHQGAFS